jgi:hypothetical protein
MTAPVHVHIGQLILDGWPAGPEDAQEFAAAFAGSLEQALSGEPAPLAARKAADDGAARSAASAARIATRAIAPVIAAEGS